MAPLPGSRGKGGMGVRSEAAQLLATSTRLHPGPARRRAAGVRMVLAPGMRITPRALHVGRRLWAAGLLVRRALPVHAGQGVAMDPRPA